MCGHAHLPACGRRLIWTLRSSKSFSKNRQVVPPLAKAREAYERGLSGHNRGKIVLRVAEREAIAA